MSAAHDIRGHLHAARLQLTFLERALAKPGTEPGLLDAAKAASDELRQLEPLVVAVLALAPRATS